MTPEEQLVHLERIHLLRERMREHQEKAGVNRCYCFQCDTDEREIRIRLEDMMDGTESNR